VSNEVSEGKDEEWMGVSVRTFHPLTPPWGGGGVSG